MIEHRDRIVIFLIADQQKFHRKLHCIKCGNKVCEVEDKVIYITDSVEERGMDSRLTTRMTVKCQTKFCRVYYDFVFRPDM
jgi:hypothetical protein